MSMVDAQFGVDELCWRRCSGRCKAILICRCGDEIIIKKHNISAEGVVSPDVACKKCNFSEFITLIDWDSGNW